MKRKKIVLFGFDMESDVGSYTTTFRGVSEATPAIINILQHHQARATFFFTAMAAIAVPEAVMKVTDADFEVGCHGYQHESFGKGAFEAVGGLPIFPDEITGRILKATKVLEDLSGHRPVSFRSPRYQSSTELLTALVDLHYQSDSSYPLYYFGEQLEPYHPSSSDWTKKGDLPVLEIPVFADLTVESRDPLLRDRDIFSVLRIAGAEEVKFKMDRMLNGPMSHVREPVFSFAIHPWEMIEIPPVLELDEGAFHLKEFLYKGTGTYAVEQLDRLVGLLKNDSYMMMTVKEYCQYIERQ